MFTEKLTENSNILKKVSIVESFYNPLTPKIQNLYKNNWLKVSGCQERSFYDRLKKPLLIDYALMLYTVEVQYDTFLIEHFKKDFQGLPTINDLAL